MIPNQKYDENKPANRPVSYETQQGVFALLCGLPASRISTRGGDKGEEESISTPSGLLWRFWVLLLWLVSMGGSGVEEEVGGWEGEWLVWSLRMYSSKAEGLEITALVEEDEDEVLL